MILQTGSALASYVEMRTGVRSAMTTKTDEDMKQKRSKRRRYENARVPTFAPTTSSTIKVSNNLTYKVKDATSRMQWQRDCVSLLGRLDVFSDVTRQERERIATDRFAKRKERMGFPVQSPMIPHTNELTCGKIISLAT